jgi:hypothetical protein
VDCRYQGSHLVKILDEKGVEDTYWELVIKDIQDACELFEPIYDATGGADGYVSVEVSPDSHLRQKGLLRLLSGCTKESIAAMSTLRFQQQQNAFHL